MGLYSSKQELFLNQFTNPLVKECVDEFMIRGYLEEDELVFSKENPFQQKIISAKIPNQKVIILALHVTYIQSDFEVTVLISNLFKNKSHNEDVENDSGEVEILCPKDYDKSVQGNDRILYKPRMSEKLIRDYAGMTDGIMEAKDTDVFTKDHPIIHFAKQMGMHVNEEFNTMDKETFEKVQNTFATHVKDGILETQFEDTKVWGKIEGKGGKGCVTIMLKMKYLLVTPGEMKLKINEFKL
jgi:hypothetical protein